MIFHPSLIIYVGTPSNETAIAREWQKQNNDNISTYPCVCIIYRRFLSSCFWIIYSGSRNRMDGGVNYWWELSNFSRNSSAKYECLGYACVHLYMLLQLFICISWKLGWNNFPDPSLKVLQKRSLEYCTSVRVMFDLWFPVFLLFLPALKIFLGIHENNAQCIHSFTHLLEHKRLLIFFLLLLRVKYMQELLFVMAEFPVIKLFRFHFNYHYAVNLLNWIVIEEISELLYIPAYDYASFRVIERTLPGPVCKMQTKAILKMHPDNFQVFPHHYVTWVEVYLSNQLYLSSFSRLISDVTQD